MQNINERKKVKEQEEYDLSSNKENESSGTLDLLSSCSFMIPDVSGCSASHSYCFVNLFTLYSSSFPLRSITQVLSPLYLSILKGPCHGFFSFPGITPSLSPLSLRTSRFRRLSADAFSHTNNKSPGSNSGLFLLLGFLSWFLSAIAFCIIWA